MSDFLDNLAARAADVPAPDTIQPRQASRFEPTAVTMPADFEEIDIIEEAAPPVREKTFDRNESKPVLTVAHHAQVEQTPPAQPQFTPIEPPHIEQTALTPRNARSQPVEPLVQQTPPAPTRLQPERAESRPEQISPRPTTPLQPQPVPLVEPARAAHMPLVQPRPTYPIPVEARVKSQGDILPVSSTTIETRREIYTHAERLVEQIMPTVSVERVVPSILPAAEAAPTINVTIGRIEVRATQAVKQAKTPPAKIGSELEAYLRKDKPK